MTVFLRAVYGPFAPTREPFSQHIDWHFFGIREDNTMGRWAVRFNIVTRKWQAFALDIAKDAEGGAVNVDAFVPDKPMVYGRTYLDVLKPRLSKEDIAMATREAIAYAQNDADRAKRNGAML